MNKVKSVWLASYTWPEVERLIGQGVDSLMLMLGATEQHGPHLPLATDTIIAEAVAEDVATRLGSTLVAPIVPLGTSDEHIDFAGTLSLSKATLAGLIADTGRSAARHGFKSFLVLSMHGGNYEAIRQGVSQLRESVADLEVIAFTEMLEAMRLLEKEQPNDVPEAVAGWHAGERETSQMLYLRPDLVRTEQMESGYVGDMRAILPKMMQVGLRPVTTNGVLGDPALASPERGAIYLDRVTSALVEVIVSRQSGFLQNTIVGKGSVP